MRYLLASFVAFTLLVGTASAEFVVWLSDKAPDANPTPGLALTGLSVGATGSLYMYGDGDTQLSGLSLDLLETGGAIKFTSATVNNPGGRWSFLDGPLTINDASITNIGGAAIPPGAPGVGGPVADEVAGAGFLLATIGYEAIANGLSNLELRVGSNLIADYDGNGAPVRLGGPQVPVVPGDVQGGLGAAGSIMVGGSILLPVVNDLNLVNTVLNDTVNGIVTGTDVATWSPTLEFIGYTQNYGGQGQTGVTQPAHAPTWDPNTQSFSWNTSGSLRGDYVWRVTGSNNDGSDTGLISVAQQAVPEPAIFSLLGLALVGCVGVIRRRS